ncbi:MAG: FAD-dependent oxidoreductase [Clostridia bacterium]
MIDIIIIGSGPSGLTAGIYALRGGASVVCFEKSFVGGQTARLNEIANFPSYTQINGYDLTQKMFEQATKLGLEMKYEEVTSVLADGKNYIVKTNKQDYACSCVIIATGATYATLGIEQNYIGRGAHYCATCDGAFYRNKTVALVGNNKIAISDAIYLSNIVKKLYFIYKGDKQKSENFLSPLNRENIEIIYNATPTKIIGEKVEKIVLKDNVTNLTSTIDIDGLFVNVGTTALTGFVANTINVNNGRIIVDANMATSKGGIFACGDCIDKHLMQIVTACADGAVAGESALSYLRLNK